MSVPTKEPYTSNKGAQYLYKRDLYICKSMYACILLFVRLWSHQRSPVLLQKTPISPQKSPTHPKRALYMHRRALHTYIRKYVYIHIVASHLAPLRKRPYMNEVTSLSNNTLFRKKNGTPAIEDFEIRRGALQQMAVGTEGMNIQIIFFNNLCVNSRLSCLIFIFLPCEQKTYPRQRWTWSP